MAEQTLQHAQHQQIEKSGVRRGGRHRRFLAHAIALEEAGAGGLLRLAVITLALIISAFIAWAAVTRVDDIITATGVVSPVGQNLELHYPAGGTIIDVVYADGALVERDSVLIRFDNINARDALGEQGTRVTLLELEIERLRAIGEGREPNFDFATPNNSELVADQLQIYASYHDAALNQRAISNAEIEQGETDLATLLEEEKNLLRSVQLLEEEFVMREALFKDGLSSEIAYLDVQRELNDAIGNLAALTSSRKKNALHMKELRSRLSLLETKLRSAALDEMSERTTEMTGLSDLIARNEQRTHTMELHAPTRGIIKKTDGVSVGSTVAPGGKVLEIIPLGKYLRAEIYLEQDDLDDLRPGQMVTLKIANFDYARHGGIVGKLNDISPVSDMNKDGIAYYKANVTLERHYVGADPTMNYILPGMDVQAKIKNEPKTLLEYLLKPVSGPFADLLNNLR